PLDLAKVVTEVRDILRGLASEKRIRVEIQVAPELTGIVLDPARLKQVLYNYLSNAIKFTGESGRVTIRAAPVDGERLRIVVDDSPVNLKLARVLLLCEGYDVRVAPDAEQALKLLETFAPALILMDIQLPGMDGLELTRRLKSSPATRAIRIIALTAYAMTG